MEVERGYWHTSWGTRPTEPKAAQAAAEIQLTAVPELVPIYAHRFLPAGSGTHGHPVLSIWGTDIIYYGEDLAEYISAEFEEGYEHPETWNPRPNVPFWKDFVQ